MKKAPARADSRYKQDIEDAIKKIDVEWNMVHTAAWSPNREMLASGSSDDTVRLWDVTTWREIHRLAGHKDGVEALAWSPDSRLLASVTKKRERSSFTARPQLRPLCFPPELTLGNTQVTDSGLKELKDLKNLTLLGLGGTK